MTHHATVTIATPHITTRTWTGPRAKHCPRCHAQTGQECLSRNGGPLHAFHAQRITRNPNPPQGHRTTLLTPDLQETICTKLANGVTLTTAAQAAGIHEATLHRWLTKGQGDENDPDTEPFRAFRESVVQARAEGAARMAGNIVEAGYERVKHRKPVVTPSGQAVYDANGNVLEELTYEWDWKAHAWILERAFASEFGKRTTVEISHQDAAGAVLAGAAELGADAVSDRVWKSLQEFKRRMVESGVDPGGDVVDGVIVENPPSEGV